MTTIEEKVLYVRLPEPQHSELAELAKTEDRSITSLVRLLLAEAVESRRRKGKKTPVAA